MNRKAKDLIPEAIVSKKDADKGKGILTVTDDKSRFGVRDGKTVKGVTIDVCNVKGNGKRSYISIVSESSSSDDKEEERMVFNWEKEIDFGYISSKNVMHFPLRVTKEWLGRNQKSITLVVGENRDTYNTVIRCAMRFGKVEWREKFMCKGWYEHAKKKRIRRRDVLGFTIKRPADKVVVNLLKRPNSW